MSRLKVAGGIEIGPLRAWPGGICLSRSIGDMDVGDYIVAVPHVKQIKVRKKHECTYFRLLVPFTSSSG